MVWLLEPTQRQQPPQRQQPHGIQRRDGRRGRVARGVLAVALGVGLAMSVATFDQRDAVAATVDDPEAAVLAARQAANAAADAYFAAEAELDRLTGEQDVLEREIDALVQAVADTESLATDVAIHSFVGASGPVLPILTDAQQPIDREIERVLSGVAVNRTSREIDDYEAAVDALDRSRSELIDATAAVEAQQAELTELRELSMDAVAALRDALASRLDDDADEAADDARWRDDERAELDAAVSEAAERDDGLSAAVGGRTGRSGDGNQPIEPSVDLPAGAILCPVAGPSGFADTWGQPRSGGRSHQGVDMLASTGTPLQAVVSGRVVHRRNSLGGTTISLYGDDGNRYYYAHLSAYEGPAGPVAAGQIIGYVGDTGNATGIPHLHFEFHPGGGVAVNPYQSVVDAGC